MWLEESELWEEERVWLEEPELWEEERVWVEEPELEEELEVYCDDSKGGYLNPKLVRKARMEEIAELHRYRVYEKRPIAEC